MRFSTVWYVLAAGKAAVSTLATAITDRSCDCLWAARSSNESWAWPWTFFVLEFLFYFIFCGSLGGHSMWVNSGLWLWEHKDASDHQNKLKGDFSIIWTIRWRFFVTIPISMTMAFFHRWCHQYQNNRLIPTALLRITCRGVWLVNDLSQKILKLPKDLKQNFKWNQTLLNELDLNVKWN
jgi:hypothetical protein